jgi:hypothetical protein
MMITVGQLFVGLNEREPNDSIAEAMSNHSILTGVQYRGYMENSPVGITRMDIWETLLPQAGRIRVHLAVATSNDPSTESRVPVSVVESGGARIVYNGGDSDGPIVGGLTNQVIQTAQLQPGRYYVEIREDEAEGRAYTLTVTILP